MGDPCKRAFTFVIFVRLSVTYPHATARLALDVFSWNLVLDTSTKIRRQSPNLVKIGQRYQALHMKTSVRLYSWRRYEVFYSLTTEQSLTTEGTSVVTMKTFTVRQLRVRAKHKPYLCVSMAITVTRTRHNVTSILPILLTLILLMWRIWWAPNNASRWQMGFNSAIKGLKEWKQGTCLTRNLDSTEICHYSKL